MMKKLWPLIRLCLPSESPNIMTLFSQRPEYFGHTSHCNKSLLRTASSAQACQEAKMLHHTQLFRNEPNHKQKQRCWRVTDDGSINVLSISRSECWMLANRTKQLVTQKAGTLLTAGDRHEYARETRRATVVKTGTARFKIWCYKCKGKHWRALSIIPRDHHRLQNDKVLSNSSLLIAYPDLGATTADEELCRN